MPTTIGFLQQIQHQAPRTVEAVEGREAQPMLTVMSSSTKSWQTLGPVMTTVRGQAANGSSCTTMVLPASTSQAIGFRTLLAT